MIIFAGIVAKIPSNLGALLADRQHGVILVLSAVVVLFAVFFAIMCGQQGRRMGNHMTMPAKGSLLIFGSALLQFPVISSSYFLSSKNVGIKNLAHGIYITFNLSA